jgi:hypothetical protein
LPSTNWLLNQNILQYSTIARLVRHSTAIEIESLIMFDMLSQAEAASRLPSHKKLLETKRCLVKFNSSASDQDLFIIKYEELFLLELAAEYTIYRIRCLFVLRNKHNARQIINHVHVAIVDLAHYRNLNSFNVTLFFHKPILILQNPGKSKIETSTVNCVHAVRQMNELRYKQTKNWLQINKLMGVGRVRLCRLIDYDNTTDFHVQNLVKHFGADFVEVVKYHMNPGHVCEKLAVHSGASFSWKNWCVQRIGVALNDFGVHEKMCANACFQNYKHIYKYLTNYDMDEFIFPRRFDKNHFHELSERELDAAETQCVSSNKSNYINGGLISNYIQRLVQFYGTRVAYFHFENYLTLNEHENLMDKIANSVLLTFNGGRTLYLDYENIEKRTNLRFRIRNDSSWWSILRNGSEDMTYFQSFKYLNNRIKRLDSLYFSNETCVLDAKWRNVLMSFVSARRPGKSIFNTDLVHSINPHNSMRIKPDSVRVHVPIDLGYVSHFRDEDISTKFSHGQFAQVNYFPIRHLVLDMEYFLFLVHSCDTF